LSALKASRLTGCRAMVGSFSHALFFFVMIARRARHKVWVARSNRRRQKSKSKTKPNQAKLKALKVGSGKLGKLRARERFNREERWISLGCGDALLHWSSLFICFLLSLG